jgi:hypothetical protein
VDDSHTEETNIVNQDQHMEITNQHKKISVDICSQDDHALIILWKCLWRGKGFCERHHSLGCFYFSQKKHGDIIPPFLKDFSYILEKIFVKHKLVKYYLCKIVGPTYRSL